MRNFGKQVHAWKMKNTEKPQTSSSNQAQLFGTILLDWQSGWGVRVEGMTSLQVCLLLYLLLLLFISLHSLIESTKTFCSCFRISNSFYLQRHLMPRQNCAFGGSHQGLQLREYKEKTERLLHGKRMSLTLDDVCLINY